MEIKPKISETQKWKDALKHICPEGQIQPITISNTIVNTVFTTETEGKETQFPRHKVRTDSQKSMNIIFLLDSKRTCLVFALCSIDYIDSFSL